MTDKNKARPEIEEKLVRVQFGKDATARAIADGIRMAQDNWALRHPRKAHDLYPRVYDENGKRIKDD